VLANVSSHNFTVLRVGMCENPLHEVVAVLVARDIDQGNTGSVHSSLTNSVEIPCQELDSTDLEAFLNYLGGVLIHTVLGGEADHVVHGAAAISRGAVLADMLNAPVTKLAMCDNVDVRQDFLDARTLWYKLA